MTTTVNSAAVSSVITVKAFDFGKIKAAYKSGKTIFSKVEKLEAKIEKIKLELAIEQQKLDAVNAFTSLITNGYTPQDLVTEVAETVEKDGKMVTTYKYEPKEGVVTFDEDKKVYTIKPLFDEDAIDGENIDDEETDMVEATQEEQEQFLDTITKHAEETISTDPVSDSFGEAKDYADNTDAVNYDNI